MKTTENTYEQFISEQADQIYELRIALQRLRNSIKPQPEAFDDTIEWDFEPDYLCPTCGAEVGLQRLLNGGGCGFPCL